MLSRIVNLPLRVIGRAARAVKQAETERQARQDLPAAARSSATLRVGSPLDVPPDFEPGEMSASAAELLAAMAQGLPHTLVDVRSLGEHRRGHPEPCLHMPDERVVSDLAEIPAGSRAVVVGDKTGAHARRVVAFLRYRGLDDATMVDGGFPAWQAALGPVARS